MKWLTRAGGSAPQSVLTRASCADTGTLAAQQLNACQDDGQWVVTAAVVVVVVAAVVVMMLAVVVVSLRTIHCVYIHPCSDKAQLGFNLFVK